MESVVLRGGEFVCVRMIFWSVSEFVVECLGYKSDGFSVVVVIVLDFSFREFVMLRRVWVSVVVITGCYIVVVVLGGAMVCRVVG